MTDEEISELIKRRRLQMLVSSFIYYELDENIISDNEWMKRAQELKRLQKQYPEISKTTEYYEEFKDWEGDSGHHLKYPKNIISRSYCLLREIQRRRMQE